MHKIIKTIIETENIKKSAIQNINTYYNSTQKISKSTQAISTV